ncbi:hypothetical protein [Microlunatus sp. GCM10028923]|uniref:hypothetical protein n=1 Tax=Microlunatus sp. GCM10028923 TaxID=3273400 RepID=UPI00361EDDAF
MSDQLISDEDYRYLSELTRDVLDASRVLPGQRLVEPFGSNTTGGTVIRPGAGETYPAFWIRDYAMSLETGFVSEAEQRHLLRLTAATQCDRSWITRGGSLVPFGAIPDHVNVSGSRPIYFPGTYDDEDQGTEEFGTLPPHCDQYFFIQMARHLVTVTGDLTLLELMINGLRLIDRLKIAFGTAPADPETQLVHGTDRFRAVDFGFRDAVSMTGSLSYPSILRHRAARDLADLCVVVGDEGSAATYRQVADQIRASLPRVFLNAEGMLTASTGRSSQPDVWGTALALDQDLLDEGAAETAANRLAGAYRAGTLTSRGSVRHLIEGDDFDATTAWEDSLVPLGEYQNGAYWGTPTGWVAAAIARVDVDLAARLIREYVDDLRRHDFRNGDGFGGPYECHRLPAYTRGPVYLTTVSVPLIAISKLRQANGS